MATQTPSRHRMVVLQEASLSAMARDPRMVAEFPFLKPLAKMTRGGCGRCRKTANRARAQQFRTVKAAFAVLPETRKKRLKSMLGAERVRIINQDAAGRAVTITF